MYPAGVPRQTNSTMAQVIKAPLLAGDKNPKREKSEMTSKYASIFQKGICKLWELREDQTEKTPLESMLSRFCKMF